MPIAFGERQHPVWDALRVQTLQGLPTSDQLSGVAAISGLGNSIIVFHSNGSDLELFDPTEAGLIAALAAAVSGDTVWLPSIAIPITSGKTIPAGVSVKGISRAAILSCSGFSGGAITLNSGSLLEGFTITISGGASSVTCVIGPGSGTARVLSCRLLATTTSGTPLAATASAVDTLYLEDCAISAIKNSANVNPFAGGVETLVDTFSIDGAVSSYQAGSYATNPALFYRVEVSGTILWNLPSTARITDANYVTFDTWATHALNNVFEFSDGSTPFANGGAYSGTHVYDFTRPGTGAAFAARYQDSDYADNSGTWTVNVYQIASATVNVEGCVFDLSTTGKPEWGDRSAWDSIDYPERHARDINDGSFLYHNNPDMPPLATGHIIEDEGTPLAQRANLNFVGASVTATDDVVNNATVVTITASGGALNVYNETIIADGLSTIYHLLDTANPGTIRVYIDGIRQPASDDSAPTDIVTFSVAPDLGAVLLFDYELEIT